MNECGSIGVVGATTEDVQPTAGIPRKPVAARDQAGKLVNADFVIVCRFLEVGGPDQFRTGAGDEQTSHRNTGEYCPSAQ